MGRLRDRPLRASSGPPVSPVAAAQLARAVRGTLAPLPTDTRCLVQSVVLAALLARRATEATVVIGVRPGQQFEAHAWVELDEHALLPRDLNRFPRLTAL